MRAEDYQVKYAEKFKNVDTDEAFVSVVSKLFNDLDDELRVLRKIRHIRSDTEFLSLVKEMNNKANKISDSLGHPLKDEWFVVLLGDKMNMPELPKYIGVTV